MTDFGLYRLQHLIYSIEIYITTFRESETTHFVLIFASILNKLKENSKVLTEVISKQFIVSLYSTTK